MNFSANSDNGSVERANNDSDELCLMIKNSSKIQAIVSAHRDEALEMFMTNAPAYRMVVLRMKHLSSMKSSAASLSSKLPSSLPSMLQELLVKSEDEAMTLFQIVSTHRDEALKMFKEDTPASRMVSLRMENLSSMKSSATSVPSSVLQELLIKSEEEAMALFQKLC